MAEMPVLQEQKPAIPVGLSAGSLRPTVPQTAFGISAFASKSNFYQPL
jgi:hypothetical protein